MKHINKPAERDPNACLRSKTVVKMSDQEMREALASVMAFRDRTRAALFAPLWKYSQDSKNADKPKDEVLTAQAIY